MSRSYRKNPVYTDGNSAKDAKKCANHKVRSINDDNLEALPTKGAAYKKVYEQYDIHDWKNRWTWEEALEYYYKNPNHFKNIHNDKEFYRYWYKMMKMK